MILREVRTFGRYLWVLVCLATLILSACGSEAAVPVTLSTGLQAWVDQPPHDTTLPFAPYTLKAHARNTATGGVTQIAFLINSIAVGTVTTNPSDPLAYAEFNWNPSAPGEYLIAAQVFGGEGSIVSDSVRVCVSTDGKTGCGGAPAGGGSTTEVVVGTVKMSGQPNPVYIGKCTKNEPMAIDFEAGTDFSTNQFARVDLGTIWFDQAGKQLGTENRAAMTLKGSDYWYHLEMSSAPNQMDSGGLIYARAILVDASGVDTAFSEVEEIQVISCGANQPPPPQIITTQAPPPPQIITTQPPPPPQIITTVAPPPPQIITTVAPPPPPKPGAIQGMVSYDSNGDGKCDTPWIFGGLSVEAGGYKTGVGGDGSFYIGDVEPGGYTAILNHPGFNAIGPDAVGVTVESGGTASAEFCLASPG